MNDYLRRQRANNGTKCKHRNILIMCQKRLDKQCFIAGSELMMTYMYMYIWTIGMLQDYGTYIIVYLWYIYYCCIVVLLLCIRSNQLNISEMAFTLWLYDSMTLFHSTTSKIFVYPPFFALDLILCNGLFRFAPWTMIDILKLFIKLTCLDLFHDFLTIYIMYVYGILPNLGGEYLACQTFL